MADWIDTIFKYPCQVLLVKESEKGFRRFQPQNSVDVQSLDKRKQVKDKGKINDIGANVKKGRKGANLEIKSNSRYLSKCCWVVMLRRRR